MSRLASRRSSRAVTIASSAEVFEVIGEELASIEPSVNINISATANIATAAASSTIPICGSKQHSEDDAGTTPVLCPCKAKKDAEQEKMNAVDIEKLLKEQEIAMEAKFQERVAHEMKFLKDRFEFILQNEQIRASYMLREANREREEKISALQTQLECKNMAGLMYVMAAERHKSRMEKLRITEEYTKYIQALQQILTESQTLIMNLSEGYKTTAKVNHEWQVKMKKIVMHFQHFVNNFAGGSPETNQYIFNLPELLKIKTLIREKSGDILRSPEEATSDESVESCSDTAPAEVDSVWWKHLEGDSRPFVVFGDMADFKPPQRREVLKAVKAQTTVPRKWKEYVLHDMTVQAECPHATVIKEQYPTAALAPVRLDKWECAQPASSRGSETSRRFPTASVDIRGNMGSILKLIASPGAPQITPKSTILAARDSMEIASTTRLREKRKRSSEHGRVVLNIGNKIDTIFNEVCEGFEEEQEEVEQSELDARNTVSKEEEDDVRDESFSMLGSIHNDSLQVINQHVPDQDHKIHYEKICPMEKCQRMPMDDFMNSLPSYMRASPFTHFEQTYEDYEACTPEQLEILKQRIEEKKKKERAAIDILDPNPLSSWTPSIEGVAVQTSNDDLTIPPCTCDAAESYPSSCGINQVYDMVDLIPVKLELDRINARCFFDKDIEFNRFQVIGQEDSFNDTAYIQGGPIVIILRSDILGKLKELFKLYRHTCNDFGLCEKWR